MKNIKIKISLTIFTLLLCFGVFAQGPPGGGQDGRNGSGERRGQQRGGEPDVAQILSMLDTNNDDKISKAEASKDKRGKISEDFDEIDTNSDAFIDLDELEASLNNRKSERKPKKVSPEKLIKVIDDNGDGTLNELEVAAKNEKELLINFIAIDTNQDNELDLEELKAFFSKHETRKHKHRN